MYDPASRGAGVSEADYIRLTDLTKLRIARHVIRDIMTQSLPQRDQITRQIAQAVSKLEAELNILNQQIDRLTRTAHGI